MYVRMYVLSSADKAILSADRGLSSRNTSPLVHTYVHEPAGKTITDHPWKASTDQYMYVWYMYVYSSVSVCAPTTHSYSHTVCM